ncbi:MAG: MMPL family transporter [Gammaproteobacteria bacterium]
MRYAVLAVWLLLLGGSGWLLSRTPISQELTVFLPAQSEHAALLSQLRDGPASRLLLLAVAGAPAEQLARISRALAAELRTDELFTRIANSSTEQDPSGDSSTYQWLFQQRYLLSPAITPAHFSSAALREALQARLRELSSPLALLSKQVLPADPTAEFSTLLARWRHSAFGQLTIPQQHGVWFTADGQRALLLAQTQVSGFDLATQSRAVQAIESAFRAIQTADPANVQTTLSLSGTGVFGVQAQALIRTETERASMLASALVVFLLLLSFRSLRLLLLGALPILTGILVAAAGVGLLFGNIHAITLAFGITLLGVAMDYPIHLFSHLTPQHSAHTTMRRLWPTLRLGVLTSLVGYSAIATTAYGGLAQLGVFAIAGLLAAAVCTRYVLPLLLPSYWPRSYQPPLALSRMLAIPVAGVTGALAGVAAVLAILWYQAAPSTVWENDLAALSPVPATALTLDRELRSALGAPEVGQMIVLSGADVETVLQASERLLTPLADWVAEGYLSGYDAAVRYLPSQRTQAARQAALPTRDALQVQLTTALAGLPFKAAIFEPFLTAVEAARESSLVSWETLQKTALGARIEPLLISYQPADNDTTQWLTLLPLAGVQNPQQLQAELQSLAIPSAQYVDLRVQTNQIMADFRSAALTRCLFGLGLMVLLLRLALGRWRQVLNVLGPVLLAVLLTLALLLILGQKLSLFHLVSLLLVVGLGLDYALFFNRESGHPAQRERTLYAILVCAGSTLLVFGIIACSQLPILKALGLTVVIGTCASLIFSVLIARPAQTAVAHASQGAGGDAPL